MEIKEGATWRQASSMLPSRLMPQTDTFKPEKTGFNGYLKLNYIVIGTSNNADIALSGQLKNLLSGYRFFSGGSRHLNLVKKDLPEGYQWIEIKGDMAALFRKYKSLGQAIVIFAS